MKAALYARYSTDHQRDASIADQLRVCRARAAQAGWTIFEEYTDHAMSGASLLRPGIQSLMDDAASGRFSIVVAEGIDRLSRDQEDIAGLFKRLTNFDVKIVTLAEGEVDHLHIGLKGTMNALFLKDLAAKTHRGLRGRVEAGKSGGGISYGYRVVKCQNASGDIERGDRAIDLVEAEIVRRIFREYAAGKSPKKIAVELNGQRVTGPSGSDWGFSTIIGNPKRGTGILNNELYVGRLVWNRQRFVKDPDTGRRQARPNAESEWLVAEVPELRIIDDDLWSAAKARQAERSHETASGNVVPFRDRRRPKHLFSGMVKCGVCGGGYAMISKDLLGCSTVRNKGTCTNRRNIRRDELERRILDALRFNLMDPDLFAVFCSEFIKEMNRARMDSTAAIDAARAEHAKIERELERLLQLYLDAVLDVPGYKERHKA